MYEEAKRRPQPGAVIILKMTPKVAELIWELVNGYRDYMSLHGRELKAVNEVRNRLTRQLVGPSDERRENDPVEFSSAA